MKKFLAMLLAVVMVLSMAACGSKTPAETTAAPTSGDTTPAETTVAEPEVVDTYTYHTYITQLANNWNPHTWEVDADDTILSYVSTPLATMSILDSENGVYQWVYQAATYVEDVTAEHQDDLDKYGASLPEGATSADVTSGYVYEIGLNPDMRWEDGTPINADTYIYSMKALLDPAMKNYRANLYYAGESAVAGGDKYYYAGDTAYVDALGAYAMEDLVKNDDGTYSTADGLPMYIAVAFPLDWTSGNTLADYVGAYGDQYFDVTNWETLTGMADENGLIPLTDDNLALFAPVTTGNEAWGETEADLPNYFVYSKSYPECGYDETVGCYKVDDYTIRYVCQTALARDYFLTSCTSNWLVYEDLYEAGKDTTGSLVTTSYNTNMDNTMSYGPYKFESIQEGKQMVLVQNEEWYGYEKQADGTLLSMTDYDVDGAPVQRYQTTSIVIDVMTDDAAKQAFLKGQLSNWTASAEELVTYGASDRLYKVDETYTMSLFMCIGLDKLKEMDASKGNTNSVVLSNINFRKAMSLAIDRSEYVTATAGYKPAFGMLNSLYMYNAYEDPTSSYRNSDEAMQAICNLYGVEYGEGTPYATLKDAYDSINGYNLTEAKALMKQACDELVAEGLYTAGEPIVIRIGWAKGSMGTADNQQVTLLNKYVNAALEGSGFGTLTFEAVDNINDRYGDTAKGEYAIGYGAWGGAAFYPFRNFQVYCDPDQYSIHEAGSWDPTTTDLTINVDGEDVTMTWQMWSRSMVGTGPYANADFSTKLHILATMEEEYLKLVYRIPLATTTACELVSYQLDYYTEDYNIMYGFGGLELMRYNYSDAEWADFVASQGGTLNYE